MCDFMLFGERRMAQSSEKNMRILTLLIAGLLCLTGAVSPSRGAAVLDRDPVSLVEGLNDSEIAKLTARILQSAHYIKQPFDDKVSSRFLDRYLDALDNLHIYFTQDDLKEFEKYRETLDDLTKEGDTSPAREIFLRFRQRLEQQFEFVTDLLEKGDFEFNTDETYIPNRRKLPRPADLDEAKGLWRDRLRYEYLQEKLNKDNADEIVKVITPRYTRILRAVREYDNDDVMQVYLRSLAHVYDPHSDYMGKAELENFSIGMKLSLFGIGALLRSEDGHCKIQSLVPGGPAERSRKMKPNDKIIAVAQGDAEPVDVVDMQLRKVVELIRGPQGSEVRLTVIPADAEDPSLRKVVSIIREEIKLEDQEAKAKLIELPGKNGAPVRLGVIDLPSFYSNFELEGRSVSGEPKSTTTDVAKLLRKLTKENISGVILDLRRNGGGSLEEAINLTGLFIKEGPVVQVRDSKGDIFEDKDTDPKVLYEGPLVVLTDRHSASASEILAGALQDYGRALVVGDSSTHGKGTVQSLIQLAPIMRSHGIELDRNPGALKITIRKFYRASGVSTQLEGVTPDIVLPSIANHAEIGEGALENPLPGGAIPSARYEKVNLIEPILPELKRRSGRRVAENADFTYLQAEIERFEKARDEKEVSLNEEKRLTEKREADARIKARKKELAARPEPPGTVYAISLKEALEPGLPLPVGATNKVDSAATNPDTPAPDDAGGKVIKSEPANSASIDEEEAEEAIDEKVASWDITLEETKLILLDLIELSKGKGSLAVTKPAVAD